MGENVIKYNGKSVNANDFFTKADGEVRSYLRSKRFGRDRDSDITIKKLFLAAYDNLKNQSVTEIKSDGEVFYNGELPDLETNQRIYGEVARYLHSLIKDFPTIEDLEELKRKEEESRLESLPVYENFQGQLANYIKNKEFGGQDFTIQRWNDKYDSQRDDSGKRSKSGRRKRLKEYLLDYGNSIKESDYNFAKSSFGSHAELLNQVQAAITQLAGAENEETDRSALERLGIDYNKWLSDGLDEPYGTTADGTVVTWRLKVALDLALQQLLQQLLQQQLLQALNTSTNTTNESETERNSKESITNSKVEKANQISKRFKYKEFINDLGNALYFPNYVNELKREGINKMSNTLPRRMIFPIPELSLYVEYHPLALSPFLTATRALKFIPDEKLLKIWLKNMEIYYHQGKKQGKRLLNDITNKYYRE